MIRLSFSSSFVAECFECLTQCDIDLIIEGIVFSYGNMQKTRLNFFVATFILNSIHYSLHREF